MHRRSKKPPLDGSGRRPKCPLLIICLRFGKTEHDDRFILITCDAPSALWDYCSALAFARRNLSRTSLRKPFIFRARVEKW